MNKLDVELLKHTSIAQVSNKHLFLIRGLPGSGKSTLAKLLCPYSYFEADQYFVDPDTGEYKFDIGQIGEAHQFCQENVRWAMSLGIEAIAVSNTFTTEKELKPYLDLAKQFDYNVYSIIVENRHGNKNIHNVPEETFNKMKNRFKIQLN